MSTPQTILKWTEKVQLSSRIIDPLGLYILKNLEVSYLPGVTTQTERLRYFSLLTWAWKIVSEKKIRYNKILDIEKIVTLTAALHHLNDPNPPRGIRNRQSAVQYLSSRNKIAVNDYTQFGRANTQGYGNYYYRGPLATLRIFARNEVGISFSSVGDEVVKIMKKIIGNREELLLKKVVSKSELKALRDLCFCKTQISNDEQAIWRKLFFGFTKPEKGFALKIDDAEFMKFEEKTIDFPKISYDSNLVTVDYLKDMENYGLLDDNFRAFLKKTIARRYIFFVIMKILHEAKPKTSGEPLDQVIRDCIYFRQFSDGNHIKKIDYGVLNEYVDLWESYVHNLYYINFFELVFEVLLKKLREYPAGTSIGDLVEKINCAEIANNFKKWKIDINDEKSIIQDIDVQINESLRGQKTSLDNHLNEKSVALAADRANSDEEKIADLILLFRLLRYRYNILTEEQKKVCNIREEQLFSAHPGSIYGSISEGSLTDFILAALNLVKNRHRLISSMKFEFNGTRSWLFTEEEGRLFYYGKEYGIRFYREAKWGNVLGLLTDMGLVTIVNNRYCLTELGESWLTRTI
jgi:hypothetical protein